MPSPLSRIANRVLRRGQLVVVDDDLTLRIGDGVTPVSDLPAVGPVVLPGGGGGGVDLSAEFDAQGDMLVGTAPDSYDVLPGPGANDYQLVSDLSEPTGAKWIPRPTSTSRIIPVQFTGLDDLLADPPPDGLVAIDTLGLGSLASVRLRTTEPASRDIIANLYDQDGVPVLAGVSRPTITAGSLSGSGAPDTDISAVESITAHLAQMGAAVALSSGYNSSGTAAASFSVNSTALVAGQAAIVVARAQASGVTITPPAGCTAIGSALNDSGSVTKKAFWYKEAEPADTLAFGLSPSTGWGFLRVWLDGVGEFADAIHASDQVTSNGTAWAVPGLAVPRTTDPEDRTHLTHLVLCVGESTSATRTLTGYTPVPGGGSRFSAFVRELGQPTEDVPAQNGASSVTEYMSVWSILLAADKPGKGITLYLELSE